MKIRVVKVGKNWDSKLNDLGKMGTCEWKLGIKKIWESIVGETNGVSEVGEHGHFRKPSIRVHQFGFIIFWHMVKKLFNIEQFFHWKIQLNENWNL